MFGGNLLSLGRHGGRDSVFWDIVIMRSRLLSWHSHACLVSVLHTFTVCVCSKV